MKNIINLEDLGVRELSAKELKGLGMKDVWYNDRIVLCESIIIPPLFFYGLWKCENIRRAHKILIAAGVFVVISLLCLLFFL